MFRFYHTCDGPAEQRDEDPSLRWIWEMSEFVGGNVALVIKDGVALVPAEVARAFVLREVVE